MFLAMLLAARREIFILLLKHEKRNGNTVNKSL
jgi:hypothetical protein